MRSPEEHFKDKIAIFHRHTQALEAEIRAAQPMKLLIGRLLGSKPITGILQKYLRGCGFFAIGGLMLPVGGFCLGGFILVRVIGRERVMGLFNPRSSQCR